MKHRYYASLKSILLQKLDTAGSIERTLACHCQGPRVFRVRDLNELVFQAHVLPIVSFDSEIQISTSVRQGFLKYSTARCEHKNCPSGHCHSRSASSALLFVDIASLKRKVAVVSHMTQRRASALVRPASAKALASANSDETNCKRKNGMLIGILRV